MNMSPVSRPRLRATLIAMMLGVAGATQAQLRLPGPSALPTLPLDLPRAPVLLPASPLPGTLQTLRRDTVNALLRQHPELVEADPAGEPIRRQELLLVSPSPTELAAVSAAGFTLLREQALPELGLRQLALRPPAGLGTAEALTRLRTLAPQAEADFNHLYTGSGNNGSHVDGGTASPPPSPALPMDANGPRRIGLVDGGVDSAHPALRRATLRPWGCDGHPVASPHGTAVASLLVGRDGVFAGALPGATLYTADIYCGQPAGGAADTLAAALAWLAREQVAVVNLSLVGPPNRLLARAVQALQQRGHLIVAAVGNDGPAAPPLYPAAYAGVVGVTGVTPARRVLPEAAQGPQVLLAAPGADAVAAGLDGRYVTVRGTSFAAPLVAGLLAQALAVPDPAVAAAALARVIAQAIDLGAPGRDPVFGAGLVAEGSRIAPERWQARR
ncbi:MAG: S8 family serine peptidase [Burkholderiales bacterium]